ncbi:myosin-4-like [Ananas comosus]|uniref:Myosin-4-like n=1 Tax=Ananas comosus TaxID=4615 RepID=A0A199US78_ANACO|nr:myosin-4-like [Ananas comosus]OAY67609.1 hypothetical protein ACMD2_05225 [Ananas comosus]
MAEINSKPFESVQAALSLFEEKTDRKKFGSTGNVEARKEESDILLKELANCKVLLEIKESLNMQSNLKLEVCRKTIEELSTQLKNVEVESDKYEREYLKAQGHIAKLEYDNKVIKGQIMEFESKKDHHCVCMKSLLNAAGESKVTAWGEMLAKTIEIDYFQMELKQVKELYLSSRNVSSDAIDYLSQTQSKIEMMQMENIGNSVYMVTMEDGIRRMEEVLQSARQKIAELNCQVETLQRSMQEMNGEMSEMRTRELELEVEIVLLNTELHRSRTPIAGAEVAEARFSSAQAGLCLAVQQLSMQAEKAKSLKLPINSVADVVIDDEASEVNQEAVVQKYSGKANVLADIPLKNDCEPLVREHKNETDTLREELETAKAEINDLRFSLKEAVRRNGLAEKGKAAIEDQLRSWRKQQQQQRRCASEAKMERIVTRNVNMVYANPSAYELSISKPVLRGVSLHANRSASFGNEKHFNYVPLGKILNMKY